MPVYLLARGSVDRVLVAPVADHPFGKAMRPFAQRLALTHAAMAACAGTGGVEVTDLEQRLADREGGPSRTLRLLRAVAAQHPQADVRLVVGSDIVADGQTARWHRWDEIEREFSPIVVPRAGVAGAAARTLCALPEVSSTEVRSRWAAYCEHERAQDWSWLTAAVPAAVLALLETFANVAAPVVWIVGRGHVATHAAPWLGGRGYVVVQLDGRALVRGASLASCVLGPDAETTEGALPWPSAVWVLVRDSATADIAAALLAAGLPSDVPVLHGAGAVASRDPAALAVLAAAGHPVGTLHPICSLRRELPWPSALGRATFGLEGDPTARAIAKAWIGGQAHLDLQALGAVERTAYHAACALAANHLVVLQREAAEVLCGQGHAPNEVADAIAELLRSALVNLLALGVPAGITGPVARGDTATVAAHVAALPSPTDTLYATLSARLTAIVAGVVPGSR